MRVIPYHALCKRRTYIAIDKLLLTLLRVDNIGQTHKSSRNMFSAGMEMNALLRNYYSDTVIGMKHDCEDRNNEQLLNCHTHIS